MISLHLADSAPSDGKLNPSNQSRLFAPSDERGGISDLPISGREISIMNINRWSDCLKYSDGYTEDIIRRIGVRIFIVEIPPYLYAPPVLLRLTRGGGAV